MFIQRCHTRATAQEMAQHSILVGVDGSEAAKDAVRWAVGVMRDDDTLCLITVSNLLRRALHVQTYLIGRAQWH